MDNINKYIEFMGFRIDFFTIFYLRKSYGKRKNGLMIFNNETITSRSVLSYTV